MKTSEILRAARALIEDPAHWTKETYARTRTGRECAIDSRSAVAFCAIGSLTRIRTDADAFLGARRGLAVCCGDSIADFNDTHTHTEVIAAFDCAIKKAEQEEQMHRLGNPIP